MLTLEVIVARTATVGYDAAKLGDFGLEAAKTDRRVQQELASRPRVEVINVVIGTDSIGRPEFTVTMRNNGTSPVDALTLYVYANNRFGEAVGGRCGRFPTVYESSRAETATRGTTFTWKLDTLCLDTTTRADARIGRAHFSDGSSWRP